MTLNTTPTLGDPLIDWQHSELFVTLRNMRALHDHHLRDEKVVDCLTRISQQIHQHFLAEEDLMLRVQMPADELAAHKRDHFRILEELAELHFKIMQGKVSWVADVQHELSGWVVEHIHVFDQPIQQYIAKANSG